MDGVVAGEPGPERPDPGLDPAQVGPPATAAVSGWVQPGQPGLSTGARRLLSAVVWLGSIVLLTGAGLVAAEGRESASSPWRIGYVAGTVAGGLALGTVIRWVWLRIRRPESERRLRSPWIPLVGAFVAAAMLGSAGSEALMPAVPVDPTTMFHVGPGYTLVEADPGVLTELRQEFDRESFQPREMAVTNIEADDGAVGLLLVMDVRVTELTSALTLEGMMIGASDIEPRREVVAGRQTMFANADGVTVVGWVDAPLIAIVYAVDDPTARAMTESVILAND